MRNANKTNHFKNNLGLTMIELDHGILIKKSASNVAIFRIDASS